MDFKEKKTLGERIKGNLSKRWQGVKNLFGSKDTKVEEAKTALTTLKKTAKEQYAALDAENTNDLSKQILEVWEDLKAALEAVLAMCEDVNADNKSRGRAYAKHMLDEQIGDIPSTFSTETLDDFNCLEDQVIILQLIANKTDRTSAIPSVIQDAAKETSRFYAYAYAYASAGTIYDKMKDINAILQNEKTLWKQIKNIFSKNKVKFISQCTVDAKKVAKEIYKQAKNAKIRKEIKTAGWMKYFGESLKDLVGMYTEPEVLKKITDETNDNNSFKNNLEKGLTYSPKSASETLRTQVKKSTMVIFNRLSNN